MCGDGTEETQAHFLLYCNKLEGIRREYCMEGIDLQDILIFSSEIEPNMYKKFIEAMWKGMLRFLSEIQMLLSNWIDGWLTVGRF